MTQEEFDVLCYKILDLVKQHSPIDTGNLRNNSIQIKFISEDECRIYVDEAIAPYMPYTNEPWLSPRWKGAKNPNERWWDNLAEEIADFIAMETNAQAKKTK